MALTHRASPGEEIDIRGPEGGITYLGRGQFSIEGQDYQFDRVHMLISPTTPHLLMTSQINLVAGGSGLTPHWQLIHAILSDDQDNTRISLIDWYVHCSLGFGTTI